MNGLRIRINGLVQGVGFRPFVYNQALKLNISGVVRNDTNGVDILATGKHLDEFVEILRHSPPPLARIKNITMEPAQVNNKDFSIIKSKEKGKISVNIGLDTSICNDCLEELFDPQNRRYLYPFINCTHCGPRYTLIKKLPYDRHYTSMSEFKMCKQCLQEYENPSDRRFHTQANCCPECGPQYGDIDQAIEILKQGGIVAIKGVGGYHLACKADDESAVLRLRKRKYRDQKPFAVMIGSINQLELTTKEKKLITSIEKPILLIENKSKIPVSPGLSTIGVMLPYAPIHHIIFNKGNFDALVMTSGNKKDEPMAIKDGEKYLGQIADYVLDHNREIVIRNDDSVVREMAGEPVFIRRSRGYAPSPFPVDFDATGILGCGAMLKNSIAIGCGREVYLSQYIGDLENEESYNALKFTTDHLLNMLNINPSLAVCDMHPDYLSTHFAETLSIPVLKVQHHLAHAHACMAENQINEAIAVVFDGVGYGLDGNSWGGEIFSINGKEFVREDHLTYMPLVGGDICVKYPLRIAAGLLFERNILLPDMKEILALLENKINIQYTSAMGRLFDAVAALLGICTIQTYEGQAPMMLESFAAPLQNAGFYEAESLNACDILEQIYKDRSPDQIKAARFHNTIIEVTANMVLRIAEKNQFEKVCFSGGCFQNLLLLQGIIKKLENSISVYTHRLTPANDNGIAFGQIAMAKYYKK